MKTQHPTPNAALGAGREFDLIRAVWQRLGARMAESGNDCAVIDIDDVSLAISTDIAIEGTHFHVGWLTQYEIGWRAAAGSLSDLAAVAARPLGVMVSLGVSDEWPEELVVDVMDGVGAAADSVGAKVWGGDVVKSDKLVIDVVVVGSARPFGFLRRDGAGAGDELWVTGCLGGPLAALQALSKGEEPQATARERFAHPVPRVEPAAWLAEHGATAMIDVSDGLVGDAGHLAAASRVKLMLDADRVPAAGAAQDALVSGEEYELLAALPAGFADADEFTKAFELPLTKIGFVQQGAGVEIRRAGRVVQPPKGWAHFT